MLGIALATILQLRLSLPGPSKEFSTADNPIAKATSIWTRFLTFSYLPVFNLKLLVFPSTLSFDWGMDAVPRLNSLSDGRNILSLVFYTTLARTVYVNFNRLRVRLPVLQDQQRRKPRAIRKRKIQAQTVVNAKLTSECLCTVCKQGLNIRHSSSCRASNNNNVPSPSVKCGCPIVGHPLPSPAPTPSFVQSIINKISRNSDSKRIGIKNTASSLMSMPTGINNTTTTTTTTINDSMNEESASSDVASTSPPTAAAAILLSIALLALPFLPAANLFFYVGFVVAERILYLPSVGYCLLIGLGVGKLMDPDHGPLRSQKKRHAAMLCFSLVLIAFSAKTLHRNGDWRDEESLYRSAISINPPKGNISLHPCLI